MSRFSLFVAASLVAIVLVACGASASAPSASPSAPPASPSAAPAASPLPSVTPPAATPAPAGTPQPATPRPTAAGFSPAEQDLLDGVQRGTENCEPARGGDLPPAAIAGIECDSTASGVARVGFYRFADDEAMLDAYLARMEAEGVALDSGSCVDGEAEGAYIPSEEFAAARAGCFINDEGVANYRLTMAGDHVYIGILGNSADLTALETFAWSPSSGDTPGMPTLWFGGID